MIRSLHDLQTRYRDDASGLYDFEALRRQLVSREAIARGLMRGGGASVIMAGCNTSIKRKLAFAYVLGLFPLLRREHLEKQALISVERAIRESAPLTAQHSRADGGLLIGGTMGTPREEGGTIPLGARTLFVSAKPLLDALERSGRSSSSGGTGGISAARLVPSVLDPAHAKSLAGKCDFADLSKGLLPLSLYLREVVSAAQLELFRQGGINIAVSEQLLDEEGGVIYSTTSSAQEQTSSVPPFPRAFQALCTVCALRTLMSEDFAQLLREFQEGVGQVLALLAPADGPGGGGAGEALARELGDVISRIITTETDHSDKDGALLTSVDGGSGADRW